MTGAVGHEAVAMPAARRRARRCALQAIYQWHFGAADMAEIELPFHADAKSTKHTDMVYFSRLVHGVSGSSAALDQLLLPCLDRPLARLSVIEHSLLRLGAWELQQPEQPWKVVIAEAVRLATQFGAPDGYKYINAVLDRLVRQLRPELGAPSGKQGA